MENKPQLGFGANESIIIGNEFLTKNIVATPTVPESFEIIYDHPHYNQYGIGICTAIDIADMMEKIWGIPFSSQFIYNIGKKMYDGDLDEGSSIKTMLRVINNYGAAPLSFVPTDNARKSYRDYVSDWFTPEAFEEAKKYKMNYGMARLDPVGFAADLVASQYGLMTRMAIGKEWYTDKDGKTSYKGSDLSPLRYPNPFTSGHAVKALKYVGLDKNQVRTLRNTWGDSRNPLPYNSPFDIWGNNGDIDYVYDTLKDTVTEAWSITKPIPNIPLGFTFKKDLKKGMTDSDVKHLQVYLNSHGEPVASTGVGSSGKETSYFGDLTEKALIRFQSSHSISPAIGFFGPKTREFINSHQ